MPSFNKNKNASASKTAPAKTAAKAAPAKTAPAAAKRPAPKAKEAPPAKEKPVAAAPAKTDKAVLATQVDIMAAVEAIIKEATGLKKLLANAPVVEGAAEKPAKAEKTEKAGKKPAAAAKDDDAGDDEGGDENGDDAGDDEGGEDDDVVEFAVGQKVIAHYPADDDNEAADFNGEITKIGNKTGKVFVTIEDSDDVIEFTPEEAAEMLEIVPEKKPAGKKEGVTKIDTTKKPAAGGEDKEAMIAEVGEKIHKLLKKVDPESPCFTKGCAHFVKNKKCSLSKMQNCLKDLSED